MIEAERNLVVMEARRPVETETQATGRGASMLCEAANMVLEDQSMDIALALGKSSAEGHILSVKFLYDLAKLQQELGTADAARRVRSLASELAAEPEWDAEPNEHAAQTASGTREPKN
jgi:hypothetical protein